MPKQKLRKAQNGDDTIEKLAVISMYDEKVLIADRLFRKREYQEAIISYNNALEHLNNKKLRDRVKTSIKLCRNKLRQLPGSRSYFDIDENLVAELKQIAMSRAEPSPREHQGSLLLENSKINAGEILHRVKASPCQVALILLTSKLIEETKTTDLIARDPKATDNFALTIGDILCCVINPQYGKELQIKLARKSKPIHICGSTLSKLQSLYKAFKEVESLREVEDFFRRNIKEKLVSLVINKSDSKKTEVHEKHLVYAGSIFLNERKFLEKCLANHYELISKWCLVEGTCLGYPTNKVSSDGFSKDFSSLILHLFPDPEGKLVYIAHGWTENEGEDAKSELRNNYLKGASGEMLVVIDIDEFYPKQAFNQAIEKLREGYDGVTVPQVHFWKSLNRFIIGGYYDISHMRFFKMHKGIKYINNHNFPEKPDGTRLDKQNCFKFERKISSKDSDAIWSGVYCYHMGFAKDADDMKDKTDYYVNRGEKITRPDTTKSRAAWFTNDIPDNCTVLPFNQPVHGVLGQ